MLLRSVLDSANVSPRGRLGDLKGPSADPGTKAGSVEITFKTIRLRRDCTVAKWMQRAWGSRRSQEVRRRLDQLHAAENLEQMRAVHPRIHELKGNRADLISLDLDGSWRLLIEPADNPPPRKDDGGLDWSQITAVRVVAVEDTHV